MIAYKATNTSLDNQHYTSNTGIPRQLFKQVHHTEKAPQPIIYVESARNS